MDDNVYFAKTDFRGENKTFGIKNSDRRQHFYIIGKSGTGKTALLANLALQDVQNNKGIAIVDPHGDFVEEIVSKIPEERAGDVIYFNPADTDYPIGFNVLEVPDPKYKHLVASDLMGIFTKIWANVWSARMEYILNNCVLALLDTPGTTLLGIPRLLVDKSYRQMIVANIKDPVVRAFWVQEYEAWRDQFRNEAIVPIQNKVGQFLSTPLIRNIVGQPKSSMNIQDIMNSGKILLVNVSKGRVGEDNSALLGAMIITKIQLAAMERVRIPENERRDFYLYVDEFQLFATDSFASILSEARKYRLNLIIAHQYVGQLITDVSTKVRDAIFGNVGTMVAFRVGATDAEFLEKEFEPEFAIQDLVNLPNFTIYLKLMVNGMTSRPFSAITLPPIAITAPTINKEKIVAESRRIYASERIEVEEQIERWSSSTITEGGAEETAGQPGGKYKSICWTCGKETETNFRPDKGRPVYCQECLKKIEKGQISAIRLPRTFSREGKKYEASLGKLGIEFSERFPAARNFSAFPKKNDFPRPDFQKKDFVVKKNHLDEKQKTISLSELQNKAKPEIRPERFDREKSSDRRANAKFSESSPHLADLREILKKTLGEKFSAKGSPRFGEAGGSASGGKDQKKEETFSENPENVGENNKKTLKPGESVKFED